MRTLETQELEVASYWAGSPISFFEYVCMLSFIEAGYTFHLYSHVEIKNLPDGVITHDASEILPPQRTDICDVRFSSAIYADAFRVGLLRATDFLWVDLDVYCLRPIEQISDYLFGVIRRKSKVNNCVLRLPRNSPALLLMENFFKSETPIPIWWRKEKLAALFEQILTGQRPTLTSLPWTTTGPGLLSWALNVTGEITKGQHWHRYYQFESALQEEFLREDGRTEDYELEHVRLIHLFGSTKLHIRDRYDGKPPERSYIAHICRRHGVSPEMLPIPEFTADVQPKPEGRPSWQ